MKKSIIALMGLFTLIACEDAYQEADDQNNEINAPPTFNDIQPGHAHGDSGDSGIIWAGDNYASPWDIWRGREDKKQPNYIVVNGHAEFTSPFNLRIRALAGLAYFDGDNDGIFNDLANPGVSFNLAGGSYPNLYANNQEAGNLVYNTNILSAGAYPAANSSFRMEANKDHLPFPGKDVAHPTLPNPGQGFAFSNLTPDEQDLLLNYGKVFFYEVQVFDKITNALVFTTLIHPEIRTLPTGPIPNANWQPINDALGNQLQGNVPGWTNLDLYHYNANIGGTIWNGPNNSGHICDSREVVFDVPYHMAMWKRPIGSTGFNLSLTILQNNFWLWQNSSLYLTVTM